MAVLEQSLADPLGDAAMGLAVQDHRVDRATDIVDRGIADDLDGTGLGIDLDLADLRAVGKTGDGERLVGDAGERPLQILWQVIARNGGRGDLENADLTIGAGDTVSAAFELDVNFASLRWPRLSYALPTETSEPEAPRMNRRRFEFNADLGDRDPLHVAHDQFHRAEARSVSNRGCPA